MRKQQCYITTRHGSHKITQTTARCDDHLLSGSIQAGLGFRMTTPSRVDDRARYCSVPSSARSPALRSTGVVCVWKPAPGA